MHRRYNSCTVRRHPHNFLAHPLCNRDVKASSNTATADSAKSRAKSASPAAPNSQPESTTYSRSPSLLRCSVMTARIASSRAAFRPRLGRKVPIRLILSFLVAVLVIWTCSYRAATAQELETVDAGSEAPRDPDRAEPVAVPQKVEVAPTAGDDEIATRLQKIFAATGWFTRPSVRVDEGVVFITGTAKDEEAKDWASNLARRTEGVVAVVNQLQLAQPSLMNLDPAWQGLNSLWRDSIAFLPFIAFGFFILIIFSIAARLAAWAARAALLTQLSSPLLRDVIARVIGILVFLLGIYIVLRISGLTRLALTVVGGTGILGLVIGIAFRDITENFLASIFLSMRRPFLVGDLVEIVGVLGYVQSLTTRSTVLMTLNGNRVEIPNSVVYKNTIRNFSTNKNRREDFTIGIGFNVRIADAQDVALRVLKEHPAVLKEPEPWALVESLGSAVVTLRIYFWLDGSTHSWLKVLLVRHPAHEARLPGCRYQYAR